MLPFKRGAFQLAVKAQVRPTFLCPWSAFCLLWSTSQTGSWSLASLWIEYISRSPQGFAGGTGGVCFCDKWKTFVTAWDKSGWTFTRVLDLHREAAAELASADSNLTIHSCWPKYRDENTNTNSKDMG